MEETGLLLLVHGEVTDPGVDVFDREKVFIERHFAPLVKSFPKLKVVLEHITTRQAVAFVRSCGPNVAATITAHHLLYNRNNIFKRGLQPHFYCLPILKREAHRLALLTAIKSGSPKFFAGTDSAPHLVTEKERSCGCAGVYTAHAAMALYAEAFASVGALDQLEDFCSRHGAEFYGLPLNKGKLRLQHKQMRVPEQFNFGGGALIPLRSGEVLPWTATLM